MTSPKASPIKIPTLIRFIKSPKSKPKTIAKIKDISPLLKSGFRPSAILKSIFFVECNNVCK